MDTNTQLKFKCNRQRSPSSTGVNSCSIKYTLTWLLYNSGDRKNKHLSHYQCLMLRPNVLLQEFQDFSSVYCSSGKPKTSELNKANQISLWAYAFGLFEKETIWFPHQASTRVCTEETSSSTCKCTQLLKTCILVAEHRISDQHMKMYFLQLPTWIRDFRRAFFSSSVIFLRRTSHMLISINLYKFPARIRWGPPSLKLINQAVSHCKTCG